MQDAANQEKGEARASPFFFDASFWYDGGVSGLLGQRNHGGLMRVLLAMLGGCLMLGLSVVWAYEEIQVVDGGPSPGR